VTPTEPQGMGTGTKILLWVGGIAVAFLVLPRLLEAGADNPDVLRRSAKTIRGARSKAVALGERGGRAALRLGQRGAAATGRFLERKLAD
jgi:hypothetical protein